MKSLVENCQTCAKHREQWPELLIPTARPEPLIVADLLQPGYSVYLSMVDYFSRDMEVSNLHKLTQSRDIVGVFKAIFASHGISE